MRLLNEEEVGQLEEDCVDCGGHNEYDVAKAQQELTNKEWREWFEQHRAMYESDGQLWYGISAPHWQTRLKEVSNEPQV